MRIGHARPHALGVAPVKLGRNELVNANAEDGQAANESVVYL
jgi:hypothetical protein